MKMFLDCEFTNFNGHLISMALVTETGDEFYEVVNFCLVDCHTWVVNNVVPILNKDPITYIEFQRRLSTFLRKYRDIEIIADWPEDFWHFNAALLTGPGNMMHVPDMSMRLVRGLHYISSNPHNALNDAQAIKTAYMKRETI